MTRTHKTLAPRDLLILATLAEGPNHGYGLIKQVEARSNAGITLDPANLYRVLRRMRQTAWIDELTLEGSNTETPPSRRRTYRITQSGRSVLAAEVSRLEQLLQQARPVLANGREP